MATIKIKQGASFAYDLIRADGLLLDANWEGKWAIVPKLGESALRTGVLALSTDLTALQLRILPSETEALPVESYILVVQLSNTAIGFSNEVVQETFMVEAQGIPGA